MTPAAVRVRRLTLVRGRLADRPVLADTLLAAGLLLLGLLMSWIESSAPTSRHAVVGYLLVTALFLPLAARRRRPRAVLVLVAALSAVIWVLGYVDGTTAVAGGLAYYGLGRYVERPASVRWFLVTGTAMAAVAIWLAVAEPGQNVWFSLLGRCGLIAGSFFFGEAQRSRAALLDSLQERAMRAEQDRAEAERRAVIEERGRIARELHDVVAHSVSVMVVQSTAAARLLPGDPAGAATSVANVAEVGRATLGEMRRLLGVLDGDAARSDLAPQPGLADLDAVVEGCRRAGLDVTVERTGTPPPLPAGVELSVVRIVQESLTNVIKHAGVHRAQVRLDFTDPLTVEVLDEGRGAPASGDSPGRGLIGMRERVEALGGRFTAGRRAGGGFAVRAVLPTDAAASRAAAPSPGAAR